MMPTDLACARSRSSPMVLRRFFATLSATLPSPVSWTASSASARLCSGSTIAQPAAVTTSSTSSCVAASNAACAARARATRSATIATASVSGSRSLPPISVHLDLRFADHVFPFLELVVNLGGELGGGRRLRLRALGEELFLDVRHGEHLGKGRLELRHDRGRCLCRRERAV